ncbi:MAG: hypothetical protein KIS87_02725 [Phycisphaeraceae bacterium]|nr:hypothetical protein [Phycisphaeraceae bacterium]
MSGSFRLRRFSSPAVLRQIEPALLVRFLAGHASTWPALAEILAASPVNIDRLAALLMDPGDDAPDPLLDALFFVDELSAPEMYEDLLDEARRSDIQLGDAPVSPADLAVRIWLDDPEVLQRYHAERYLVRTKKFEHFPSVSARPPVIRGVQDVIIQGLQDDLDAFFETRKKGRGTRVFPFVKEEAVWFLVRHGEKLRREGTIENGESSSVFYRPEKYDIVIFDRGLGELAVHADAKGETAQYCRAFGKRLFNDELLFSTEVRGRFTLAPIVERGPDCLVCSDVDGLESVRLTELRWRHDSQRYHVEIHQSDDVFAALEEAHRSIPASATLLKAVFKMKFRHAERERSVAIKPPNAAVFDRESDAPLVHDWLVRRRFTPHLMRVMGNVA